MMGLAPSARPSIAAASPTGPSPVMSNVSCPDSSRRSKPLVRRAETARHKRTVDVGQLVRQKDAGGFLGKQKFSVSAVALPAVGCSQRRRTADHVAVVALLTHTAAGNVIHHNPVAHGESTATGTDRHHLTARLVPSDHAPVRLRPATQMLPVDGADITAADRRGLHLQQHLTMSRFWDIDLNMLDGAVAGKDDAVHRCHDVSVLLRCAHALSASPDVTRCRLLRSHWGRRQT